ncbi:MAG: hypothetical protein IPG99_12815 [Ignavibacteria bacterium]|nr:hypothetical protein [Ignavibacteria bacterium]
MRHSHYHAFIGKFLQQLYDSSGKKMLIELKKRCTRGLSEQKAGSVNEELKSSLEPGVVVSHNSNIISFDETDIDTGPQYSGDKPFTKRMRFQTKQLQSKCAQTSLWLWTDKDEYF